MPEWLKKKNVVSGNPACLMPHGLKGRPLQDLSAEELICEGKYPKFPEVLMYGVHIMYLCQIFWTARDIRFVVKYMNIYLRV